MPVGSDVAIRPVAPRKVEGMAMTREEIAPDSTAPGANNSEFKLFYTDSIDQVTNLVAVGTDDSLYLVPAEPGGWLNRSPYDGQKGNLTLVSPTKAAFLVKYLYGDIGFVRVAPTEEIERAPQVSSGGLDDLEGFMFGLV
jgi:hypothetical protein